MARHLSVVYLTKITLLPPPRSYVLAVVSLFSVILISANMSAQKVAD